MDELLRDILQLRQPRLDELSVGVVVLCLLHGVEVASLTGVTPYSGGVLPVAPVRGGVVVDELFLEGLSSGAPVDHEVLRQVAGG